MEKWDMTLGEFVAMRRKYMMMTQEKLAEELHVSKSAIAKWETDGGIPDRDNFRNLAKALNVTVDELYRIAEGKRHAETDKTVNITNDVINLLESYGYKVIKNPDEEETRYEKQ